MDEQKLKKIQAAVKMGVPAKDALMLQKLIDVEDLAVKLEQILSKVDLAKLEYIKGDDGHTPIKGTDYDDGEDGYTPVKGKDYFDGEDGKTPTKDELIALIKPLIEKPEQVDTTALVKQVLDQVEVPEIDQKGILDALAAQIPQLGMSVRDALELLPEGEKLLTSSIEDKDGKNLDIIIEELKKQTGKTVFAGGGARAANQISVDTTNFAGNLSAADDTVQKALDTLDDMVGGGGGTWGSITGTLSNQTDLQSALDAKAASSHTHTASQITDFDTEVSNNTDVAANTAARHDAVTVLDSSEIDFTLTGQQITASIVAGSIDETKLDTSTNASLDLADGSAQKSANLSDLASAATAFGNIKQVATTTATGVVEKSTSGENVAGTATDVYPDVAGVKEMIDTHASGGGAGSDTTAIHDNESGEISAITAKTTPVDADVTIIEDSAASNAKKSLSWANIKATIKTYYDSVSATLTNKTIDDGTFTGDSTFPSGIWDSNGYVGIGTGTATYRLNVSDTRTDTSGNAYLANYSLVGTPSAASSADFFALNSSVQVTGANNGDQARALSASAINTNTGTLSALYGLSFNAGNSGAGTVSTLYGVTGTGSSGSGGGSATTIYGGQFTALAQKSTGTAANNAYGINATAQNSAAGTLSTAYGVYGQVVNSSTGAITTGYGARLLFNNSNASGTISSVYGLNISGSNTGTITNTYGLRIDDITSGTQTNQAYAIYLSDANARNYFASPLGINVTAPTAQLDIKGTGTSSSTTSLKISDSGSTAIFTIRDDGGFAFKGGTIGTAQTGYTTPTNLSTTRTFDADSVTIDTLADVLGTLIQDLKTKAIISA